MYDNEFSFIESKIDTTKKLFINGKHVDEFHAIDYLDSIPILLEGIQELTKKKLFESKIGI